MRSRPLFWLCILALGFALSTAVQAATYRGLIGKQAVVVELFEQDNGQPREGQYAYLAHGQVLLLKSGGESVLLTEYRGPASSEEAAISGYWQLQRQGNGWQGRWMKQPGEQGLPITLEPARLPKNIKALLRRQDGGQIHSDFDLLLATSPARKLHTSKMQRKAGTIVAPQHWQRGKLRIEGFVLAKPEQPGDARINDLLRLQLQQAIGDAEQCEAGAPSGLSDYAQHDTLRYASLRYLSVTTLQDYFCGGAYPNSGSTAQVYDRRSGRSVDLGTEVYQIDGAKQAEFRKLVASHLAATEHSAETGYGTSPLGELENESMPWLSLNGIDADGVVVGLRYPHVAQAGDMDITIPYASMQPFLRPESRHDFLKQH
ncbi:hypothetical protein [Chitinolyticbacter meiyuanensis]|uniref:hypothetical protein n=1 Tax=Chitinolyticbacter meiyuanensis TaxID=682798 RepID=UPI0011E5F43B|nr:hypothetical protein [Chitinolyticbacter meiyuanensis]